MCSDSSPPTQQERREEERGAESNGLTGRRNTNSATTDHKNQTRHHLTEQCIVISHMTVNEKILLTAWFIDPFFSQGLCGQSYVSPLALSSHPLFQLLTTGSQLKV